MSLNNILQRMGGIGVTVRKSNISVVDQALLDRQQDGEESDENMTAPPPATNSELVFLGAEPEKEFKLEDLLRGSPEALGRGTLGTSFKAELEDGTTVVVKRLRDVALNADDFRKMMEEVGAMRHENLLPLRAYYYGREEKLLLYDYVPNRSLSTALHGSYIGGGGGRTPPNWEFTYNIALGAARAIEYLHSCGPGVFHGNIKSSNVLLTKSYDVQVSDYGLAYLQGRGYQERKLPGDPHKVDVYSFGVLLLELLTGKSPNSSSCGEEGIDLARSFQSVAQAEMAELLKVAMECTSQIPEMRPPMSHVRQTIENLHGSPRALQGEGSNNLSDLDVEPKNPSEVARKRWRAAFYGLTRLRRLRTVTVERSEAEGNAVLVPQTHPPIADQNSKAVNFIQNGFTNSVIDTKEDGQAKKTEDRSKNKSTTELTNEPGNTEPPDGVLQVSERVYGKNMQIQMQEGLGPVTETNLKATSYGGCASSSADNSGSMEDTVGHVHSSPQVLDTKQLQEEPCLGVDSSSSASMSSGYDYDVFLSFRGPDARSGIVDSLYTRLSEARIHTFIDNEELRKGKEIGPELSKAINQSKISIPIFSRDYASSKWCLNELTQMVECTKTRRQKILPIFYNITPHDVRHQIGSYQEAFASHEKCFDSETISKWKAALSEVGKLKGWDISTETNRREGELVKQIVQVVIRELKSAYLLVTDCLVIDDYHVKEINGMVIQGNLEDVRVILIHGMGGVGKTTLAKIIYNQVTHHFEHCSFLPNISKTSKRKGIEHLQKQLVSDVLKVSWQDISDVHEGIKTIKDRLRGKKVLVLLDDVDKREHLDALMGKPVWFGSGSRIIITSRNRDLISVPGVINHAYELVSMDFNHSFQLFCKHAFGREYPSDDYVPFCKDVVRISGGLPLALEVLGLDLVGKGKNIWDITLKKLEKVPHDKVKKKLKKSYDALDDRQKHIFLDIACLFVGFDRSVVLHGWADSGLYPDEGLEVLQRMSLIKIGDNNKLWMHRQLRELGREIVRKKCNVELEKRTRLRDWEEALDVVIQGKGSKETEALWQQKDKLRDPCGEIVRQKCNVELERQTRLLDHEQVLDVMIQKKGSKETEAICVKLDYRLLHYFTSGEFSRPSILRYFEIRPSQNNWPSSVYPINLLQGHRPILSKLRCLSWNNFLLVNLTGLKLVEVPLLDRLPDMSNLKNLAELHLSGCCALREIQSLEGLENLETLELGEIPLVQTLLGLSNLRKLIELHLWHCQSLSELQGLDGLENLIRLKLDKLPQLERLSDMSNLKELTKLEVQRCQCLVGIKGRLESLENLCIDSCRSLKEVDNLSNSKKLKSLLIRDCKNLRLDSNWMPLQTVESGCENGKCWRLSKIGTCVCQLGAHFFAMPFAPVFANLVNLRSLTLIEVPLLDRLLDISNLKNLIEFHLWGFRDLHEIQSLEGLENLEILKLGEIPLVNMLPGLSNLRKLKELHLWHCSISELRELDGMENLITLRLGRLPLLERLPDMSNLKKLTKLEVRQCQSLVKIKGMLESLEDLKLIEVPLLDRLPDISNLKNLIELHLSGLRDLHEIQSLESLENLEILKLGEIPLVKILPDLSNLRKLRELHLWHCSFSELRGLDGMENLITLKLVKLPLLERLPDMLNLKKLTKLEVRQCQSLVKIKGMLESLEDLWIDACRSLSEVPHLSCSKKLKSLHICDCEKLRWTVTGSPN